MKQAIHLLSTTVALLSLLIIWSCSSSTKEIIPSVKFAPYINAYTGGVISQASTIRIELTQDQPLVELNGELKETPFSFTPSLKGKAYWINNNTIEFTPEPGTLQPGKLYQATFELGNFVQVESDLKQFDFSFRVQQPHYALTLAPLTITAQHSQTATLQGELRFSDAVALEQVAKMITITPSKQPVVIEPTNNPTRYTFTIKQIERQENDYHITLHINGKAAGIDSQQSQQITIPAKGSFTLLSQQRIAQPENGIQLVFSDPVCDLQELRGLIDIPQLSNYIFEVTDNKVNIYFAASTLTTLTLNIDQGVRSKANKPLGTSHALSFDQLNLKPQVEIATPAAIMPHSKNLILPFRAVALHAVDLSVIRIFESNVLTFMQTNTLGSANELRRSGRLVYKKTLHLAADPTKDVHRWEDYSIDLSGLIKQEPGAIYRVVLSFTQAYSAYPCAESQQVPPAPQAPTLTPVASQQLSEADQAAWDQPQAYYYYNGSQTMDWSQYQWTERDNPCNPSYYMGSDKSASCNVLASNLGVIVKQNSQQKLWITVSDICSTQPVTQATVTAYNFQLQAIGQSTTDAQGFAVIQSSGVPFIVMAQADKDKAYVRVADGEEQSVSRFDVGGKDIQKGLKGFVYGERGVWRPGDTLHISFVLQDKEQRIPASHPVALEVYTPQGQFYHKLIAIQAVGGFYTFALPTKADDPTGVWNAYIKVGGTAFHKALRIETIKPNRLKINLHLPSPALIQASQGELPTTLSATWLTGATASQLRATVEMTLTKVNTQFKNYTQYLFNNPATEFSSSTTAVFSGTLNPEGSTSFTLKMPPATNAPGMLRANITSRVFEPGGDASISTITVPYSPFSAYVGINLNQPQGKYIETDKKHQFDIVTVDAHGKPVNRTNLEYKIYRIGWSWWWESSNESFQSYINSSSITPVASGKLATQGGKAHFSFQVDYPAWGRYLVYVKDNESGHATGGTIYVDWPDWRGRSQKTDPSGITMLAFSIDKEQYEIGQTVTAIIPASAGGKALIALENGSEVIHREWIEVPVQKDTKYQFKVTPSMAPNIYLHISLLQPHGQTVNQLPIRMYGVVPVLVTNKQTLLQPQIKMPDVLQPQKEFAVTVSEQSGKPMTYTLAIVDDGLLDLTNFKTPDPWNEFYAREALGIRTWDMYNDVLGAYTGSYSSLFSTGGDETLKPSDAKANRFKPVVKFLGPFALAKGKSTTHRITLPMYVGSVRTMVVAGQSGAYGQAEKTTPVRTPLMVLSTLPRVMSTQEEILLPINVFAMESQIKNVTVSVRTKGIAQVVGAAQQSLTFSQTGDQLACFSLKTTAKTGKETIVITATGGGQTTQETIEIEVRNPNPALTTRQSKWIEGGQTGQVGYALATSSKENSVRLEVSRIPSVDISRQFDFLYNYEHHCTEQLTSKALPLLFIAQFKELTPQEAQKIKANVQEAIKRLYARQMPSGGFVYWPGNGSADEWITSYAGMFLLLAQEKGYEVNANVITKWKRFQRAAAQNWRAMGSQALHQQSDVQQAYRLYTLALASAPEQGAMNRMKEIKQLSQQAKWRLAAAYALTGKTQAATELIYNTKLTVTPYDWEDRVYGSYDRDEAMILETLLLMGKQTQALEQAKRVSHNLSAQSWFNTQSTGFALLAMGRLAEKLSGTLHFSWRLGGKQQPVVKSAKAIYQATLPTTPSTGTVGVTNNGKGALWVDVITRTQLINDTLPPTSHNLRMEVSYTNMAGATIDIRRIKQGTDFLARVTVGNISGASHYTNLALTHIVPSGWEIYNERMIDPTAGATDTQSGYTYRDIRDDRILTYFDLNAGQVKLFTIRLQATYAGTFVLPAVQCQAMYNGGVQARTQASRVVVER